MTLVVYWYDFVCFGIVAGIMSWSIWVIWQKESGNGRGGSGGQSVGNTSYESLLVDRPDSNGVVGSSALTRPGHLSSIHLWTSCWRGFHPQWLLALRCFAFVVMAVLLIWDAIIYDITSVYMYYTEWTFLLDIIYFGLGTFVSARGCLVHSKSSGHGESELLTTDLEEIRSTFRIPDIKELISSYSQYHPELLQTAGRLEYLMQILYQTCAGATVLTDVVFWCLIVPFLKIAHVSLNPLMGCMHSLNALFLLLDASLNSLPFPWFRISYFLLWSCAYVIFQWIIHACGFTWWPYPFLVLSSPWAPLLVHLHGSSSLPLLRIIFTANESENLNVLQIFSKRIFEPPSVAQGFSFSILPGNTHSYVYLEQTLVRTSSFFNNIFVGVHEMTRLSTMRMRIRIRIWIYNHKNTIYILQAERVKSTSQVNGHLPNYSNANQTWLYNIFSVTNDMGVGGWNSLAVNLSHCSCHPLLTSTTQPMCEKNLPFLGNKIYMK